MKETNKNQSLIFLSIFEVIDHEEMKYWIVRDHR